MTAVSACVVWQAGDFVAQRIQHFISSALEELIERLG
jgi:hypothetical protein